MNNDKCAVSIIHYPLKKAVPIDIRNGFFYELVCDSLWVRQRIVVRCAAGFLAGCCARQAECIVFNRINGKLNGSISTCWRGGQVCQYQPGIRRKRVRAGKCVSVEFGVFNGWCRTQVEFIGSVVSDVGGSAFRVNGYLVFIDFTGRPDFCDAFRNGGNCFLATR